MTEPRTHGELIAIINEYFDDLQVRVNAARDFCLAITLENTLQNEEIRLMKLDLEDKFGTLTTDQDD